MKAQQPKPNTQGVPPSHGVITSCSSSWSITGTASWSLPSDFESVDIRKRKEEVVEKVFFQEQALETIEEERDKDEM